MDRIRGKVDGETGRESGPSVLYRVMSMELSSTSTVVFGLNVVLTSVSLCLTMSVIPYTIVDAKETPEMFCLSC